MEFVKKLDLRKNRNIPFLAKIIICGKEATHLDFEEVFEQVSNVLKNYLNMLYDR